MTAASADGVAAPIVEVTRTFCFSAAHRMHNPRFSAAENRRLYGRCNHPGGHGHTYRLDVTVRGPISPETGTLEVCQPLAQVVQDRILSRFDHADLDRLITPADGVTSTTEVLTGLLWRILDTALPPGCLSRLRVEETPNNFFEMDRDGRE
jgi:6-pyruvoyltetrahydropterin/6-carboxytetrahydropterin synthase